MERWRTLQALLTLGSFVNACGAGIPESDPHPLLDTPVSSGTEMTLEGTVIGFPPRERVTLLDFWATSCAPCVEAMPALETMRREREGEGLVVIGIAADDNPGLVRDFVQRIGVHYPIVMDPEGRIRGQFLIADLPHAVLLDEEGRVR
jgi:cytochrome c biogenesis protein CcmG/thiol:disulfide interchange protein DsbE